MCVGGVCDNVVNQALLETRSRNVRVGPAQPMADYLAVGNSLHSRHARNPNVLAFRCFKWQLQTNSPNCQLTRMRRSGRKHRESDTDIASWSIEAQARVAQTYRTDDFEQKGVSARQAERQGNDAAL